MSPAVRNDWTLEEVQDVYNKPLLELIYEAATVHRNYNDTGEVQVCTLLSIKTGGCPEDCAYCPQAAKASQLGDSTVPCRMSQVVCPSDELG